MREREKESKEGEELMKAGWNMQEMSQMKKEGGRKVVEQANLLTGTPSWFPMEAYTSLLGKYFLKKDVRVSMA